MSKRYSIAEARSNLPDIVNQAASGAEIELTRRGKPVAVMVSLQELERLRGDRPRFSDVYAKFLKKYSLKKVGLEGDFFASIRGQDTGREVSL
jgi:prevent-host-death family protein